MNLARTSCLFRTPNVLKRQYSSRLAEIASFSATSRDALPIKKNIVGLTLDQLQGDLQSIGANEVRHFTALQIWQHIYKQGVTRFHDMTSLPKRLREILDERYIVDYGQVKLDKTSKDGTRKWLVGYNTSMQPNAVVESVLIPEPKRSTLCVSSQIGCSLRCSFCHTGTQKLLRNLTAAEVVGQYMIAAHRSGDFPLRPNERSVSNMVFMGQGEPLYNWRNIRQAVKILTDPEGLQWPKPKITISTSGVAPLIPKIASELGVSLAISLHATRNDLRDVLVPLNKTYPIDMVLNACRQYAHLLKGGNMRRITFEYVMLDNVNDSAHEARELVRLLKQLPAHVNLIPFNPWPGSQYKTSKMERIDKFAEIVINGGIHCTVRRPRGQDIMAACGQLKSNAEQKGYI
ncbi:hypothetical protein VTP01DRAFT_3559 [Rhizomucor pusillus]|uniref:uncharacterized protein n=1 Tax=Rhizomucor pusillus TaxID=4840 RepID=UPI00374353A7